MYKELKKIRWLQVASKNDYPENDHRKKIFSNKADSAAGRENRHKTGRQQ
jgi:hypothetical protein